MLVDYQKKKIICFFLKALRLIKNQINFEAVIMGQGILRTKY